MCVEGAMAGAQGTGWAWARVQPARMAVGGGLGVWERLRGLKA